MSRDLKFTVATKGFGIDVSAQGVSIVLTLEVGPDKSPELVHDLLSRIHQAIHAWHDAHVVHSSNCDTTPPARLAPKYPDDDDGA